MFWIGLQGAAQRIRGLVDDGSCAATLVAVRRLNDPEGEQERSDKIVIESMVLEELSGQHQLLGWHLGPEIFSSVAETRAELDVDEYGWPSHSDRQICTITIIPSSPRYRHGCVQGVEHSP